MAKVGRKPKNATANGNSAEGGESISGYFRKVFAERPDLLVTRSNDELLRRWLEDHPDETEVSARVKQNLANLKSVLRKKNREKPRRGRKPKESVAAAPAPTPAPSRAATHQLEMLEEHIDDSLTLARHLDREGLETVIKLLRRARNEVVWKLGQ